MEGPLAALCLAAFFFLLAFLLLLLASNLGAGSPRLSTLEVLDFVVCAVAASDIGVTVFCGTPQTILGAVVVAVVVAVDAVLGPCGNEDDVAGALSAGKSWTLST